MYKTLGGYTWDGMLREAPEFMECSADAPHASSEGDKNEESIKYSAQQFHLALDSLKSVRKI